MKTVVPFTKARETSLYGSKAVGLGDAARQGLPVPPGVALSGDLVEAVAAGNDKAIEKVAKAVLALSAPFAVRSSAIDEDGAIASFAGQHLTVLNVHSAADVPDAVRQVWWSANSDSAITYRQSACSSGRVSALSSRHYSTPLSLESCSPSIRSPVPMSA